MNGLIIRYFMGGFYLCDGKAPIDKEEGGFYIGNPVKWFETLEEAKAMLKIIDEAYGKNEVGA